MGEEPPNASQAALAVMAARADRRAFDELHQRLSASLRALLERRGLTPPEAEELAARAWAGAWEACTRARYDPRRAAFSTFLFAIAHNLWVTSLRARPGPALSPDLLAGAEATAGMPAPEAAEAIDALRAVLRGDLGDLTERERLALRLSAQGSGDREIAERLGVAPSTAHATKQAAYAKLRRVLGHLGLGEGPERDGRLGE
jgi:RNA polymerase sigma factor (sigma-70 family)